MEPAVDERLRGGLGLVPVARDHVGAADEQLADPGFRVLVEQVEVAYRRREADRVGVLGRPLVRQVSRDRGGLGQPETVADPPARSCYPLLSKSELWNFNELVLISFCRAAKPAPVPWHFGEAFRR